MWCYDYYPIYCRFKLSGNWSNVEDADAQSDLENTSLEANGKIYVNRSTFLWLETFSRWAKETGRPFWYVGLSREFQSLETKNIGTEENPVYKPTGILRRYANETCMRFSAFSALAYGAKGLAWWSYTATRGISGNTKYNFNAPYILTEQNNIIKTELWDQLKTVNKEVRKFNDIFMRSYGHEVYHTGRYIYNGNNLEWAGITPFPDSKNAVLGLVSDKMGVLVSFFSVRTTKYVMLVNHDIEKVQDFFIAWDPSYVVDKIGDAPEATNANASSRISVPDPIPGPFPFDPEKPDFIPYERYTLQPGGYMMFKCQNKSTLLPVTPTPSGSSNPPDED